MSEHDDLFAGFAVLEPSAEDSARAVERTRAALLASSDLNSTAHDGLVRPERRSAESLPTAGRVPAWRRAKLSYLGLASAATVLLVIGAMALINSRSAFAWSDIVRRTIGARALRCVMEAQAPDGKWMRSWEWEYDHEKGYAERHYDRDGLARTDIDNGHSHWVHRRGQKVATRQPALSAASQLEKLLNPVGTDRTFQPEPAKDEVLDGAPCQCLTALDETRRNRASIWIDEHKRLRRAALDHEINGKWVTSDRVMVTYDVELDVAAFEPSFDSDVKVVDLDKLFEETFPLDKAVHRQEQFGYVFTIHELKRLGNFEYFMVMSFRPTAESRKALELRQGEHAGQLSTAIRWTPGPRWERETGRPLAKARTNGIEVNAYFMEFSGFELPPKIERARPQIHLFAHGKLWGEFGAQHDILFDVPLPEAITPNEQVVRSLYDTIATLEGVPMDELYLHDPLDDREFVESQARGGMIQNTMRKFQPRPSEISFETFFEHVQKPFLNGQKQTTRVEPE